MERQRIRKKRSRIISGTNKSRNSRENHMSIIRAARSISSRPSQHQSIVQPPPPMDTEKIARMCPLSNSWGRIMHSICSKNSSARMFVGHCIF
jgi:hypothetical protein